VAAKWRWGGRLFCLEAFPALRRATTRSAGAGRLWRKFAGQGGAYRDTDQAGVRYPLPDSSVIHLTCGVAAALLRRTLKAAIHGRRGMMNVLVTLFCLLLEGFIYTFCPGSFIYAITFRQLLLALRLRA